MTQAALKDAQGISKLLFVPRVNEGTLPDKTSHRAATLLNLRAESKDAVEQQLSYGLLSTCPT